MVAENKNAKPDAQDQNTGSSESAALQQSSAEASAKILQENAATSTSSSGSREKDASTNTPESSTAAVNDGSDSGTATPESTAEQMRREVQETLRSAAESVSAVAKMVASGRISPELAAKFGNVEMFDSADGSDDQAPGGQTDALTQEAKAEEAKKKTTDNPADTDNPDGTSSIGDALSDFGNWAADSFNKYVAEPVSEAMGDVMDMFDSTSEWMFNSSDVFGKAPDELAGLNNVSNREFNQQQRDAMRNFDFDLTEAKDSTGEGLRLPENAVETGTTEIGGTTVSVMRTPEGDTFLKKGDKVVGHQKPDGSYELALKDGSSLDFKLSEGKDGKYQLDSLERTKDGKVQQKIADGVFYNYNYDAQGNKTSVDAAGDLKGPLSHERLEAIKKELGDSGAAALRVTDGGDNTQRLLMQVHNKDTNSLTDIDARRAQIFQNGQEYRLNERDQLGLVDSNGQWKAPDDAASNDDPSHAERVKELEDLARRVGRRAHGDSDEAVDGVKLRTDGDNASITRVDPVTGKQVSSTEVPADTGKPVTTINSLGEKTEIKGDNIGIKNLDGKTIFNFDRDKGLNTEDMKVDKTGLTDLETGTHMDPEGNVTDADGEFIGGPAEEYFEDGEDCEDCVETKENQQLASSISGEIRDLGSRSLSLSHNPGNMHIAKQIAVEAFGMGNAALGAVGNDLMAAIPINNSLSVARTAFTQASRSEKTQTYAMNQGVSDTTRLSDINRIGTLSSTSFSPEEFVRDRLMTA
ncbi:MAG: hypothetical protein SGJ27_29440 [Candidatus Melainabacteria bacterium]|nr:hypothetical protein [Candidatus Melainabacteria bacterium]